MNKLIENPIDFKTILKTENMVDVLDEQDLKRLSDSVFEGLNEDEQSWGSDLDRFDEIMDLALMTEEKKNFPWEGASNVKWPLTSMSMVQFTSTSSPEFVKNGKVFDYRKTINDETGAVERRGNRNIKYYNYKILKQYPNKYIDETESMLNQASLLGTSVKKIYVDPVLGEVISESIPYDCITYNKGIKDFSTAPRITEWFNLSMVEYLNLVNMDEYVPTRSDTMSDKELTDLEIAKRNLESKSISSFDDKSNFLFISQFTYADLDGDGYPEPYFIICNVDSREILRISKGFKPKDVKRKVRDGKSVIKYIKPQKRYIAYRFILSPDLSFPGVGFGSLLHSPNKVINTLANQLINSGTLATTQSGFYDKSLNLPGGEFNTDIGKYQEVDSFNNKPISDSFHQLTFPEPSQVLFQMLGMVLEAAKDLTATTDALLGKADTQNASPDVIQQMVAQGKKVLVAILRRILATAEEEASLIVELMAENVDPAEYARIVGVPPKILTTQQDPQTGEPVQVEIDNPEYNEMFDMSEGGNGEFIDLKRANFEIIPVIDSNSTTKLEENFKYDSALMTVQQTGTAGLVDMALILKRKFKALGIENVEELVPPPKPAPPDPKLLDLQSKIDERGRILSLKEREQQLKEAELQLKAERQTYENEKTKAEIAEILEEIRKAADLKDVDALLRRAEIIKINADVAKTKKETGQIGKDNEKDTDK
jgi:chaperonin GroES